VSACAHASAVDFRPSLLLARFAHHLSVALSPSSPSEFFNRCDALKRLRPSFSARLSHSLLWPGSRACNSRQGDSRMSWLLSSRNDNPGNENSRAKCTGHHKHHLDSGDSLDAYFFRPRPALFPIYPESTSERTFKPYFFSAALRPTFAQ
jgi:hypothetical protein